jgi:hypothetical protein
LSLPAAAAVALLGCPSNSSTSVFTPVTGIGIDSTSLVAGLGCGIGTGQVFQYAVVLSYQSQADGGVDAGASGAASDAGTVPPGISGVFDCFADGLFSNLPPSDAGATSFVLSVFAFNEATFPASLSCSTTEDGSTAKGSSTGVSCPGNNPANVNAVASRANWTTTCTAPQVDGVTVFAVCNPLVPTGVSGDAGADASGNPGDAGATPSDANTADTGSTSLDSAVGD